MASPSTRSTESTLPAYPKPAMRKLRIYAFDPQASIELDTAVINDAVIELPWETPWEDALGLGPVNEYLEVIDFDPACEQFYAPVDLNDPMLLAQNGLPPSEGRPQFHQQMVFAVAMKTIRIFERALGRPVMWTRQPPRNAGKEFWDQPDSDFVKKLRIYPHALREPNAYYSPEKTALLFGYFKKDAAARVQDDGWVFTCLSQDIIAHETTHAILHGMQRRSIESTNVDSLAFHEAFSDIVALFQHFSMTSVVEHQLKRAKGSLRSENLLNGLAQQFGQATGRGGALRSALGMLTEEAHAKALGGGGAVQKLEATLEPHTRGQFLVAAVFDAFVTIYERRTEDLFRLAGDSIRSGAELSPDLVGRLAMEARKAAEHILRMCVRALDYIPPVDLEFGEYLRAIITADTDLIPDDPMRYRVAIVEAFRKRGIFVKGAISMAPDSLMWEEPNIRELPGFADNDESLSSLFASALGQLELSVNFQRASKTKQSDGFSQTGYEDGGRAGQQNLRSESIRIIRANQAKMHSWLVNPEPTDQDWEKLLGIKLRTEAGKGESPVEVPGGIRMKNGRPAVDVHSVRVARRQGPDGQELHQLVVQITQKRRGYFDPAVQKQVDEGPRPKNEDDHPPHDFWFRGGSTVLVDLRDGRLRRVIRKRIDNEARLAAERAFQCGDDVSFAMAQNDDEGPREPFAFMHRGVS
jgi:hypothetical protein